MFLGFNPRSRFLVGLAGRVVVGLGIKGDVFFGERIVDCVVEVDAGGMYLLREVGLLLSVEIFLFFTAFEALQLLSRRLAV